MWYLENQSSDQIKQHQPPTGLGQLTTKDFCTVLSKNGKGKRFQLLFKRTPAVNTADSQETTGEKGILKNYHEVDIYDFF